MIDKHIHHTFWCFNENSSDTGGLVYDNFEKWDEVKYEFVKPALWQDDNGKFISLDHTIPLGQAGNGISLSQHYSGSPSTPTTTTPKATTTTTTVTTTPKDTETTTVTTTTTAPKDTTTTTVTTPVTPVDVNYGDANCDKTVDISDVVLLKSWLINSEKYSVSKQGLTNADVQSTGNGVNGNDIVAIQQFALKLIDKLPV